MVHSPIHGCPILVPPPETKPRDYWYVQALYWVWDNMCFLNRIKFIEIDCDKAAYRSDVAWYVHSSTN
jgi:hypothetical protein